MSFSKDTKTELTAHLDSQRHCRLAELTAICGICGEYAIRGDGKISFALQSENILAIKKAAVLIRRLYHLAADVCTVSSKDWKNSTYLLFVRDTDTVKKMLYEMKLLKANGALVDLEISHADLIPDRECCRRAFLRGVFICSGSISDPKSSYHFEIPCKSSERAGDILKLLEAFEIDGKTTVRSGRHSVYVKEADRISEMLGLLGATNAMLEFENIRIYRGIAGDINRQVNCETANIKKTAKAGAAQVEQINKIAEKIGLASLSPELYEAAMLRLENPDTGLAELGAKLDPPVGKSGMYHRFAKIKKIAEDL